MSLANLTEMINDKALEGIVNLQTSYSGDVMSELFDGSTADWRVSVCAVGAGVFYAKSMYKLLRGDSEASREWFAKASVVAGCGAAIYLLEKYVF